MSTHYKIGFIKLSHFSVKEYLISQYIQSHHGQQVRYFSFSEELSHALISQICLAYLLQFNTSEPLGMDQGISSPLAKYAAEHWIIHAHSACKSKSQSSAIFALTMKLLRDGNNAFMTWVQIYDIDESLMEKQRDEIPKPLYYALLAGLSEASYKLLEMRADINAQGGECGNALQAASYGGHEVIAKHLIQKGADVHAQGGRYGNALQAASYGGHEGMTKLLIEKGADVNAQGGFFGNALYAASSQGHEAVAKLLIKEGADVNAQGQFHGNALQAASYGGHEAIAKLLIDKGADVNAQGGHYGNALQAASLKGHEAISKLLIKKGADVDVQGGCYGNALQAASYGGHKAVTHIQGSRWKCTGRILWKCTRGSIMWRPQHDCKAPHR